MILVVLLGLVALLWVSCGLLAWRTSTTQRPSLPAVVRRHSPYRNPDRRERLARSGRLRRDLRE